MMPALIFGAGRLSLLYYDLREDVSKVFGPYVDEFPMFTTASIDVILRVLEIGVRELVGEQSNRLPQR